jgi:hypothetical protein
MTFFSKKHTLVVSYDYLSTVDKFLKEPNRRKFKLPFEHLGETCEERFGTDAHKFIIKQPRCRHCGRIAKSVAIYAKTESVNPNPFVTILSEDGVPLTIDHILPKCKGGTNIQTNLQTLCYYCNQQKGASTEQLA